MSSSFIKISLVILSITSFTGSVLAAEAPSSGQNAFTRAVQKPLADVLTPVPNTHATPCNSVVECRKYGGDLKTIWQINNGTDFSPKDYPEDCYVLGDGGKYYYKSSACALH